MTFAAVAAIVGLAVAVATVVTVVAIVTWSDRRRSGLFAMLPSAVLAIVLGLAVCAWVWVAPIWLPLGVYAIGVGWWIVGLIAELRMVRRTSADTSRRRITSRPMATTGQNAAPSRPKTTIGKISAKDREDAEVLCLLMAEHWITSSSEPLPVRCEENTTAEVLSHAAWWAVSAAMESPSTDAELEAAALIRDGWCPGDPVVRLGK